MINNIIVLFFLIMLHLSMNNIININVETILFGATIVLLCHYNQIKEHITEVSNEAIQTVASSYNANNMTVTNLKVTGTLEVGGDASVGTLKLL